MDTALLQELAAAKEAIRAEPNNPLHYLRKGKVAFELEEYEAAKAALEKGAALDPGNAEIKTWLRKCNAELEAQSGGGAQPTPAAASGTASGAAASAAATAAPAAPAAAAAASPTTVPAAQSDMMISATTGKPTFRHDWYQTASSVVVSIYAKGQRKENVHLDCQERELGVSIALDGGREYQLNLELWEAIDPSRVGLTVLGSKIEISLPKKATIQWPALERSAAPAGVPVPVLNDPQTLAGKSKAPAYPTSRPKKTDWDALAKQVESEKPEGDEALTRLFQDIYRGGTEEQRRAMMKSFVESGGTVLSTNWDEVGKGVVKGSPPPGLEMHSVNEHIHGRK